MLSGDHARVTGPTWADPAELEFAEAPDDLRDLVVVDPDSHRIGEVDGLLVDPVGHRTQMLVVGSGGILGLGRVQRLVPATSVLEITDRVRILTSHRDVHLVDPYVPGTGGDVR
jgi:hypothetical protein